MIKTVSSSIIYFIISFLNKSIFMTAKTYSLSEYNPYYHADNMYSTKIIIIKIIRTSKLVKI